MSLKSIISKKLAVLLAMAACSVGVSNAASIYVSSQSGLYVVGYDQSATQIFQDNLAGQPIGLTLDRTGNLYAGVFLPGGAGNKVMEFTSNGALIGTFASLPSGVNGPFDVAFDATGNLYVSALNTGVVEKYDSSGNFLGTLANIASPRGLTVDSAGNLWVVSTGPTAGIYRLTNLSTFNQNPTVLVTSGITDPRYDIFDSAGNLYVSNTGGSSSTGYVEKYQVTGGTVTDLGVFGSASGLGGPNGLGFDASGNLYVADFYDNNVREFSPTGTNLGVFRAGIITANGLAVSGVPEPATFGLLGLGLAAIGISRLRRK